MTKSMNLLTDTHIRNAQPKEKMYTLKDGGSLFLEVFPTGGKYWRFGFRFPKGDKTKRKLSLGAYPKVSLKTARELAQEARQQLAAGKDPRIQHRGRRAKAGGANTFEAVASEWLDKFAPSRAASYTKSLEGRLRLHLFPWIGQRPVDAVTPQEILATLRRIEAKGHLETAHRVLELAGQVFNYAIQTDRASVNPALPLKGALPPAVTKHMAAITEPQAIGRLLVDIDRYQGNFTTLCALKLSPLVFLRPGELRRLQWAQVDLERAEIRLPIEHMKRRQTEKEARRGEIVHTVPLSRQALVLLADLRRLTGDTPFLFPHYRKRQTKTMSNMTVLNALRSMGYDKDTMSAHGFRALASTNLNEQGFAPDFIERQLAHKEGNAVRAAYNHAEYLDQRRAMMQAWADWLDERKEEARQREAGQGRQ